jgi:hypothetical protein
MKQLLLLFFLIHFTNAYPQGSPQQRRALPELSVSARGGFYEEEIKVLLSFQDSTATIYYTLDGRPPGLSSKKYKEPIVIGTNATLQAIAMKNEKRLSSTLLENYFIEESKSKFPIISIAINPNILYDRISGLMQKGNRALDVYPYKGSNFYSNKEVLCTVEIFENSDSSIQRISVFKGRMGLSIFGGVSRTFPQKSFALYARSEYGNSHIEHRIFPDLDIDKYKRLVLRNSGSDFGETHFRDAFITSIGKEMGLEVQAYRPALVFINGLYHGVMNLREKLTKHYFEEHFGVKPDSIDLLEAMGFVKAGSRDAYNKLQSFLSKKDLNDKNNFIELEKMMDIDNFIEFQTIQIYSDNQDAGGNVKYWRERKPGSKWRWVLFDTDFGFGHYSKGGYNFNTLEQQNSFTDKTWPNPDWSTYNFRMLMKSEIFRKRFLTRFCDRMNSTFAPDRLISRIDSMAAYIKPEMSRHWKRWELSPADWEFRVKQMKEFADKRPAFMKAFLKKAFPEFGNEVRLQIYINGSGRVLLNSVIDIRKKFVGFYFKGLDVNLKAIPNFGHMFSHWKYNDKNSATSRMLNFGFETDSVRIEAVFIKKEHPNAKQIIINEISCRDTFSGDWIEFYNSSDKDLNLEGWILKDASNNQFVFPDVRIKKKAFLLLCREKEKFIQQHPKVKNVIGGLSFGLDRKRDRIELYTADEDPVDSVGYKIGSSKDSILLVLALRDFESDNSDYDRNWEYELGKGSPGEMNPNYLPWKNRSESASDGGQNLKQFLRSVRVGLWILGGFFIFALIYIAIKTLLKRKNREDKTS